MNIWRRDALITDIPGQERVLVGEDSGQPAILDFGTQLAADITDRADHMLALR